MVDLTLAWVGTAVTVVLLAVSAFFSSSETAIFSLPAEWFDEQDTTSDDRVAVLKELRDDPHRLLVTLLVGNNVVNVAISSIVTVVLASYASAGVAVTAATVLTSCAVLIFGEIVPKSYGLGNAERWSLVVAGPIALFERVLSPLVTVFDVVTRHLTNWVGGKSDIEEPYTD